MWALESGLAENTDCVHSPALGGLFNLFLPSSSAGFVCRASGAPPKSRRNAGGSAALRLLPGNEVGVNYM